MLIKKNVIIVHATCLGACSFIRQHAFSVLAECGMTGDFEIVRSREPIDDDYILAHTAAVWILRPFMPDHVSLVNHYARRRGKHKFRIVADYDDLLWDVNGQNLFPEYNDAPLDTLLTGNAIDSVADKFDTVIVSTEWLRACWLMRYREKCDKVEVVGNALPRYIYGHNTRRVKKVPKVPKVLYGGSICHHSGDNPGDFGGNWIEWLATDNIELHLFGETVPAWLKTKRKPVLHAPVGSWVFPQTVREIGADIYIAPLLDNAFNRAKSNLKLLEASALGVPLLASWWEKFCPYHEAAAIVTPETDPKVFTEQLRETKTYNAVLDYQDALMESKGYWMESDAHRDRLLKALLGDFLRIER